MGELLLSLRNARGLSRREVSNHVYVTEQTIYNLESGIITNPGIDLIAKLADFYDVTTDYILGREVTK